MRADGSSLFLPDNRWGYFPGVAVAWKLKEENFLKNSKTLNDLKIRLGWGKTGQQDITSDTSFYPSVPLFDIGSNTSQYLDGVNLYSARAFNPNLTWEKTTTNNIGIDFDLFKNSIIAGSLDVYSRKTNDLLARVPLPAGQSLSDTFVKNVGSTKSEGFEVSLTTKVVENDTFSLSFNSNVSYNKSTVESFENVTTIPAKDSGLPIQTGVSLAEHVVGYQPRSAWVFEQIYDATGRPAVGAFVDRNSDGQISNDDRYYVALVPNWTYGFGLNFNYKNIDLSASFRGQIGGQVYNSRRLTSGWTDKVIPQNTNSLTNVLDFYNGAADIGIDNINGNIPFSDYFLEDASFLRCDNIVLGYKFNKFFNTKSFRIYAAVNNAFLVTKYSGQDPENFNSIDNNFYPRPRMYTFGLSLDF
jgi:TonB-dependent starch-binding outer membrane protein SusC